MKKERMKSVVSWMLLVAVVAVGVVMTVMGHDVEEVGGVSLALSPLATQKSVFLSSLKEEYEKIDTWLNNAEDLSSFVTDAQVINFPEGGADPEVYKNKTEDIDSVEPEETVHSEELDVYDSQNYKIRNIWLHALPFDKIKYYTRKSADSIMKQEIRDAAYNIAPETEGNKTIFMSTSGAADSKGYKMMTIDDVVALAQRADRMHFPEGKRVLVLPSDWWWELVNSNTILKGQLSYQQNNGIIEPKVVNYYGIKIEKSMGDNLGLQVKIGNSTVEKDEQGAVNGLPAALFFCGQEVYRAGGTMEMFYKDKSVNTEGRAYEIGFQHRFKAGCQMNGHRYTGLIYKESTNLVG